MCITFHQHQWENCYMVNHSSNHVGFFEHVTNYAPPGSKFQVRSSYEYLLTGISFTGFNYTIDEFQLKIIEYVNLMINCDSYEVSWQPPIHKFTPLHYKDFDLPALHNGDQPVSGIKFIIGNNS